MNMVLSFLIVAVATLVGVTCVRAIKQMKATQVSYAVLDWRELFSPRKEYPRSENPGAFRLHVTVAAFVAVAAFTMAIIVGLILLLYIVAALVK